MSKNLLDNGTVITLGLVGAVAAIGAMKKRGSSNKHDDLKMVRDRLNEAGFNFVEDEEYTEFMRHDPEFAGDRKFVDEHHKLAIRLAYGGDGDLIEVIKRFEFEGERPRLRVLGTFAPSNIKGILSVVKRNASKRKVGSRALAKIGVRVKDGVLTYTGAHGQQLVLRKPGLPNLDAMSESELMSLWHATYIGGFTVARFLFPNRPKDYVRTTRSIGGWASNKATAMKCRASGDTHGEEVYENIAASIYHDLPAYARWK